MRTQLLRPDFLIVGSARSGTTLLQRLVAQETGVRIPPETHFFTQHWHRLILVRWPVQAEALDRLIAATLPSSPEFDGSIVRELLGGIAHDPLDLLGAIVRSVGVPVVGEKTPGHLRYLSVCWRYAPQLPVIAVIRDPRAVVSSYLRAPFGTSSPEGIAMRWVGDQRYLRQRLHGRHPLMIVRYEDLVQESDQSIQRVTRFLVDSGIAGSHSDSAQGVRLFDDEEFWKARATQPVAPERVDSWRSELLAKDRVIVERIARREADRWGYQLQDHGIGHAPMWAGLGKYAAHTSVRRVGRALLRVV